MTFLTIINPFLWIAALIFVTLNARRNNWKVDYIVYIFAWIVVFLRSLLDLLEVL